MEELYAQFGVFFSFSVILVIDIKKILIYFVAFYLSKVFLTSFPIFYANEKSNCSRDFTRHKRVENEAVMKEKKFQTAYTDKIVQKMDNKIEGFIYFLNNSRELETEP